MRLPIRRNIKLVDPAVAKRHKSHQLFAFKPTPDLAAGKDDIIVEARIFVGGVKACKPRQSVIEGRTVNSGRIKRVRGR
jgi:hypothetical protein